jgi:hypothetical protein
VLQDPGGRERLLKLGLRTVPVVAQGERYVFAQNIEHVASFVGVQSDARILPPPVLFEKWIHVLRAAQRFIGQFPDKAIEDRVIPNRDRSIRLLGFHIFRLGDAFLETVVGGELYSALRFDEAPASGTCTTGDEIARYGEDVIGRLERWWGELADRSCGQEVSTYYGPQSVHQLLERSTWHCAQHIRQIAYVLERYGSKPDGPLTAQDLAGLPLPERLFE